MLCKGGGISPSPDDSGSGEDNELPTYTGTGTATAVKDDEGLWDGSGTVTLNDCDIINDIKFVEVTLNLDDGSQFRSNYYVRSVDGNTLDIANNNSNINAEVVSVDGITRALNSEFKAIALLNIEITQ